MPSQLTNRGVFNEAILPEGSSRLGSFGAGIGLEFLVLAIVLVIPILLPQRMVAVAHNWVTPISAPILTDWKPQPPPKPVIKKLVVKEVPKPVEEAVVIPKPKIYNPVIASPIVQKPMVKRQQAPQVVEVAKDFPVASLGSSAIPDLKKPREAVQTGGFGDPNSVPDNHNLNRNPNMTQAGGFDMPAGAGVGNGTGGAKGAKGVVASTGFGNGVAVVGNGSSTHGAVQTGGFGDEHAATPQMKQASAQVSRSVPMEILFVPKPQYTDEARAKKVEGDVVLQVVFTASGDVKVLRVVQGLGYGLDEAAESAARQIRFHPAQQDGQPVDTTANVRMKCALAY
jgi:TonB family protein